MQTWTDLVTHVSLQIPTTSLKVDFLSTCHFELQHASTLRIPDLMWKHSDWPKSDSDASAQVTVQMMLN